MRIDSFKGLGGIIDRIFLIYLKKHVKFYLKMASVRHIDSIATRALLIKVLFKSNSLLFLAIGILPIGIQKQGPISEY